MVHPEILKLIGTATDVLALFLASAAVAFAATGQSIGVRAQAMTKAPPFSTVTVLHVDGSDQRPVGLQREGL
jgi:hypothetical protein